MRQKNRFPHFLLVLTQSIRTATDGAFFHNLFVGMNVFNSNPVRKYFSYSNLGEGKANGSIWSDIEPLALSSTKEEVEDIRRKYKGYSLIDEVLTEMDMTTGGRCVKRCPQFTILGVYIRSVVDQQLHHILIVIDTALKSTRHIHQYIQSHYILI